MIFDIVIYIDTKTSDTKVLKNRYGHETQRITEP